MYWRLQWSRSLAFSDVRLLAAGIEVYPAEPWDAMGHPSINGEWIAAATIVVDSRAVDCGAVRLIQAAEEADKIGRS
jgi:hypothetical protein